MPNYGFRSKSVKDWSQSDMDDFKRHIVADEMASVEKPAANSRGFAKGYIKNIFDSASFQGLPNSPFAWHRELKSRLAQADLITQDLNMLQECADAGMLDGMTSDEKTELYNGMANKMAVIRYGYMAAGDSARAADYKSDMAITMRYGGVDMVADDINQWKSGMQEMLNSEYEKANKSGARYVCKFSTRGTKAAEFSPVNSCAFYDADLLDAYVQEYIANNMAQVPVDGKPMVKDLYRFTTSPGDYDLKYRITKTAAIGQGLRIMAKEDWVNNYKAQATYSGMGGWGVNGDKYRESQEAIKQADAGDIWHAESKARMDRAQKLYDDLEALSELPVDANGSLKYQPSFATCVRCGWVPNNNPGDRSRSVPKDRENLFRQELLFRTLDVLYGPDIAAAVNADPRKSHDLPVPKGDIKNDIQKIWDELNAGKFAEVQERVVNWHGARMELIEQEDAEKADSSRPRHEGTYHGQPCQVYSDAAAVACMEDILRERVMDVAESDKPSALNLPVADSNLMYEVYSANAGIRGEKAVSFEAWHEAVLNHPDWDLTAGEFVDEKPELAPEAEVENNGVPPEFGYDAFGDDVMEVTGEEMPVFDAFGDDVVEVTDGIPVARNVSDLDAAAAGIQETESQPGAEDEFTSPV